MSNRNGKTIYMHTSGDGTYQLFDVDEVQHFVAVYPSEIDPQWTVDVEETVLATIATDEEVDSANVTITVGDKQMNIDYHQVIDLMIALDAWNRQQSHVSKIKRFIDDE
jgi:hypothetical protein